MWIVVSALAIANMCCDVTFKAIVDFSTIMKVYIAVVIQTTICIRISAILLALADAGFRVDSYQYYYRLY